MVQSGHIIGLRRGSTSAILIEDSEELTLLISKGEVREVESKSMCFMINLASMPAPALVC